MKPKGYPGNLFSLFLLFLSLCTFCRAQQSPGTMSMSSVTSGISCPEGYTIMNGRCEDINECASSMSPCNANAMCTNTNGSFSCSCNSGFAGDGLTCEAIDACKSEGNNVCPQRCENSGSSYVCVCSSGYTGDGRTCVDIQECSLNTHNCHPNATCMETPGSFTCSCNTGYSGNGRNCADIDECAQGSPCDENAVCTNTAGSFSCQCNTGFTGSGSPEDCTEDILLQSAQSESSSDRTIRDNSEANLVTFNEPVPVGDTAEYVLYLSTYGVISFDRPEVRRTNGAFGTPLPTGKKLFAPFWANIDLSGGALDDRVYWSMHRSGDGRSITQTVLTRLNSYISLYLTQQGGGTFSTTTAFVATWYRVRPNAYFQNQDQTATFQFAFASNGLRSFAVYIYQHRAMRWTDRGRQVVVGHSFNGNQASLRDVPSGSFPFDFYRIQFPGTNRRGVRVIEAGAVTANPPFFCYRTFLLQAFIQVIDQVVLLGQGCPARQDQASRSFDLIPDILGSTASFSCFATNANVFFNQFRVIRRCCYRNAFGLRSPPFFNQDASFGPLSRVLTGIRSSSVSSILLDDFSYFQSCCPSIFSRSCRFYGRTRPLSSGRRYRIRRRSNAYGDPHFTTIDGKGYTYNGLGDYVLLVTNSSANSFSLQCRTSVASTNDNSQGRGTVFTGFAVTETGTGVFEFLLNLTSQQVSFYIDGRLTNPDQFSNTSEVNNTYVSYQGSTLKLSFASGFGVSITSISTALTIVTQVPDSAYQNTRGLLGVYNDDVNDDFTLRNGSIININSTEEQIFYQFGDNWKVTNEESNFAQKLTPPSYTPTFFTNVSDLYGNNTTLLNQATAVCGGLGDNERQCLYDIFATGSTSFGNSTSQSKTTFTNENMILALTPPVINGPTDINVTFNETRTFRVNASSSSSSAVLAYSLFVVGATAQINVNTGEFTFMLESLTNASLQLQVTDLTSNTSVMSNPTISACACLNGGICNFTQESQLSDSNSNLVMFYDCICPAIYTGKNCETMLNPCDAMPCFNNVTCTPSGPSRSCGPCPSDYSGDGVNCFDINECSLSPSLCEQNCTNFIGGYNCSCISGYSLVANGRCQDINECQQTPSVCSPNATCTNTNGSYTCQCNTGFSGDGQTCQDINECNGPFTVCSQNCTNTPGSYVCSCESGFISSGRNCTDVDECQSNNTCGNNAQCFNIPGSFFCLCNTGFTGDGQMCNATRTIVITPSTMAVATTTATISTTSLITAPSLPTFTGVPMQTTTFQPTVSSTLPAPTSSVVTTACTTNPCQNNGICQVTNGITQCQCTGIFYGNICNENQPSLEVTLAISSLTVMGTTYNFQDQNFRNDLLQTGSAVNLLITSALQPDLTNRSKNADARAIEARIQGFTFTQDNLLRVRFSVAFNQGYSENPASFAQLLNSTYEGLGYRVNGTNLMYTVIPSAFTSNDLNECSSSPCHSMATCTNSVLSFKCTCNSGYEGTGFSCSKIDSNRTTVIIAVTVTLGCLLLLIIAVITYYHFRRKRKLTLRANPQRGNEQPDSDSIWAFINNRLRAHRRRADDQ